MRKFLACFILVAILLSAWSANALAENKADAIIKLSKTREETAIAEAKKLELALQKAGGLLCYTVEADCLLVARVIATDIKTVNALKKIVKSGVRVYLSFMVSERSTNIGPAGGLFIPINDQSPLRVFEDLQKFLGTN